MIKFKSRGNSYWNHTYRKDNNVWSVPNLWELAKDLPVIEVPIESMDLSTCPWVDRSASISLYFIAQIIHELKSVDLSYPIILSAEGKIMDGYHRLLKAVVEGHDTVKIVRFEETPEPDKRTVSYGDM